MPDDDEYSVAGNHGNTDGNTDGNHGNENGNHGNNDGNYGNEDALSDDGESGGVGWCFALCYPALPPKHTPIGSSESTNFETSQTFQSSFDRARHCLSMNTLFHNVLIPPQ